MTKIHMRAFFLHVRIGSDKTKDAAGLQLGNLLQASTRNMRGRRLSVCRVPETGRSTLPDTTVDA